MRISFSLLIACSVALVGCGGSRSGSVRIADVTKSNSINLTSGYSGVGSDLPSGITLHVHGQIDGSAYIHADNWEPTKLNGTVEWRIYHDWFKSNCVLHYKPDSVRSGELTVNYTIH
jgi:hypothetical protein